MLDEYSLPVQVGAWGDSHVDNETYLKKTSQDSGQGVWWAILFTEGDGEWGNKVSKREGSLSARPDGK